MPRLLERYQSAAPPTGRFDDPGCHLMSVAQEEFKEDGPKLFRCRWRDIVKDPGWVTHEEVECPTFVSVGWLVFEDDLVIKLADTIDDEGTGYGVMAIPRGVVIELELIA